MKKMLAWILTLLAAVGMLAGCAGEEKTEEPVPPASEGDKRPETGDPLAEPDKAGEPFVYNWIRTGEESVLNPHDANRFENYDIVDKTTGMLYFYVPSGDGRRAELVPNLAEGEPAVAADGVTWTIKIHPEAKWANGEKIDAHTFEYSLKMAMDPTLFWGSGQQVCANYITIKNAQAYYRQASAGEKVDWADVGVKAVDDQTLQIVTEGHYTAQEVMRHFYLRSTGPVYRPIYEKCISADGTACDYGTGLDKYLCSGQFTIESWEKGAEMVLVPNEHWLHREMIHIDRILSRVVGDESTGLELFEKGQSDYISLGTNGMARYGEDPRVLSYAQKAINTIEVNQNPAEKLYLKDPLFRKALFYAIDRGAIARLTHNRPAPYFLSTVGQILDDGTLYRDLPEAQAIVPKSGGYDPQLAVRYFEEVLNKYSLDRISLNLIYTEDNSFRRAASEYIQADLTKIFGADRFEMTLSAMAAKAANSTMRSSQKGPVDSWDLAWSGWGLAAESFYPWKKFEKYTSANGSRYTNYQNARVDALYEECLLEENRLDDQKLAALTVEMEKAMYEDMTCIPVFQNNFHILYSDRVELPMTAYNPSIGYGWIYAKEK